MYDPLVFYTDTEIAKSHKTTISVQELIEQGEIHIMTHCSSTSVNQAGLIPERVACLDSLSDPVLTEDGIKIYDKIQLFKGDKQSAWFEAGIQRGGHYCCIACNCHSKSFTNFTQAHHSELRGFQDIQKVATDGVLGRVPNKVSCFESLNREELQKELVSRQIHDFPPTKKGMAEVLKSNLCGVQRVPALLLNPCADPMDMNLIDYTVLSFEPLHDLQGHIHKLLDILPGVITQPVVKARVGDYLKVFYKKNNLYGSDLREAIIQVMHILVNCKVDSEDSIFILVQTLVKISEIAYSSESRRSPKQCLQFYNCLFLHHEIFMDLFKPDKVSIYFHSLLVHGPLQHELVCSQSANAEAEECLFKQAGNAAKNTDHKPDDLVEALLVRLQCKQLESQQAIDSYTLTHQENSRIKKVAETLPHYSGSLFSKSFIQTTYLHSRAIWKELPIFWSSGKVYGGIRMNTMLWFSEIVILIQNSIHRVHLYSTLEIVP